MAAHLGRALEILDALQRAREHLPAVVLADRIRSTTRTVERIVRELRDLGFGIESMPGPHGGYRLGPGTRVSPLLPSENEIIALLAALRSAAFLGLEETDIDHSELAEKLLRMLPERHRTAAGDLSQYVAAYRSPAPKTSARVLRELGKCCRLRTVVAIDPDGDQLESSRATHTPTRTLEPHRIVQNEYLWYLIAWDRDARAWVRLRVDRIRGLRPLSHRFVQREIPDDDVAAFTVNAIATVPYACRVEAVFAASAEELAGRFPPDAVHIEPINAERCVVHTGAETVEAVAVYLLAPGVPFTIRSPVALRHWLREVARRLDAAGRDCPPGGDPGVGGG
ncbi:helix-turn-helix transcriptional regulator [Leucobacter chromiireducens]|uniref:WYL domain-containing transcriptional regulator n=1 Tax=Leucobacter chromiireducens subsp. solipictus TaxID=398235 RepID=A0ABS1SI28_9MICO|nr:WYL domain-containing protein [Leucobacter chromiireducens]MBL3680120.1 WYL domain-containing transcriptional regulator [Leucobacter chromiireducens subsp. solipictus]